MAKNNVKIGYSAAQFCVKVEFTKADTLKSPFPPPDIIEKAKKKLSDEKEKGNIAFFVFHQSKLLKLWQNLRNSKGDESISLAVNLGVGVPMMQVKIKPIQKQNALCYLQVLETPKNLVKWRYELFRLFVERLLKKHGVTEMEPDLAQLHTIFLKACSGEKVRKDVLYAFPKLARTDEEDELYQIRVNKKFRYISLIVFKLKEFMDQGLLKQVLGEVKQKSALLRAADHYDYQLNVDHIKRTLQTAYKGPERYGFDLPIVLLAALARGGPLNLKKNQKQAQAQVQEKSIQWDLILPLIDLDVSPDEMVAKVGKCSNTIFQVTKGRDILFWKEFFKKKDIVFGLIDKNLDTLCRYISHDRDPEGLVIAKGKLASNAEKPYIFEPYLQTKQEYQMSFVEAQPCKYVKKGEVAAEYRFEVPGQLGVTVWGNELPFEEPELPEIEVGEGIKQADPKTFVADFDGVPEVDETKISMTQMLIYDQDVSRTDGAINFDGNIEINGSIKAGSQIRLTGELIVNGTVEGGHIVAGADICVEGGIVISLDSLISCRGNIKASFIENAKILCEGDLLVQSSIISTDVIAGGNIMVASEEGIMIGGNLSCLGDITCANIGRSLGSTTTMVVGYSYQQRRSVDIRQSRLIKLQERFKELETLLSYLNLPMSQMTKKKKEQKASYRDQIKRIGEIVVRMETRVTEASERVETNTESTIRASGALSANCNIKMGENEVEVPSDLAEIIVLSKQEKGSWFQTMNQEDETMDDSDALGQPDDQGESDKSA